MKFSEYVAGASTTAIYPGRKSIDGLGYVVMGLAGELGEVFEVLKKIHRDDAGEFTPEKIERLKSECGDVFWYLSQVIFEVATLKTENEKDVDITQAQFYKDWKGSEGSAQELSTLKQQKFFISSIHEVVSQILSISIELEYGVEDTEEVFNEVMRNINTISVVMMIFLANIDIKVEDVLKANLDKLSARKEAGKIGGSGETLAER